MKRSSDFFLMIARPPRSTHFPYATLFRSRKSRRLFPRHPTRQPGCLFDRDSHVLGIAAAGQQRTDWLSQVVRGQDRKSTRLNSSHANISYAVFCSKKKNKCSWEHITLAFS